MPFQAGEEELWYATVKFTGAAKDSDHVKKLESEYATVVVNTPDPDPTLLDQDFVVGESSDICIEEWIICLSNQKSLFCSMLFYMLSSF